MYLIQSFIEPRMNIEQADCFLEDKGLKKLIEQ